MEGTDTMFFLHHSNIHENIRKYVTYGRIVVDYSPPKYELHRTHLTVGGNLIKYPGEVSTRTAYLTTKKISFKSTISTL